MTSDGGYWATAIACIVTGAVVHLQQPGHVSLTLVIAGAGALSKVAFAKSEEARIQRERADEEQERADRLFEETQNLRSR